VAMSEEHKAALARGRREARVIKAYLKALESRRPGRPVSKESLEARLAGIEEKIDSEEDPLRKLELLQSRLDMADAIAALERTADMEGLEAAFVENAASYGDRKGISYTAWRQAGVPATTLRRAGIRETRRR